MENNFTIEHISDGNFQVVFPDGTVKTAGPKLCGMIRYTYFEDYTLPEPGWKVTNEQLLKDYHPKVFRDMQSGKFEESYTDDNGVKHYKHVDDGE